jgi:hypothetical protein
MPAKGAPGHCAKGTCYSAIPPAGANRGVLADPRHEALLPPSETAALAGADGTANRSAVPQAFKYIEKEYIVLI